MHKGKTPHYTGKKRGSNVPIVDEKGRYHGVVMDRQRLNAAANKGIIGAVGAAVVLDKRGYVLVQVRDGQKAFFKGEATPLHTETAAEEDLMEIRPGRKIVLYGEAAAAGLRDEVNLYLTEEEIRDLKLMYKLHFKFHREDGEHQRYLKIFGVQHDPYTHGYPSAKKEVKEVYWRSPQDVKKEGLLDMLGPVHSRELNNQIARWSREIRGEGTLMDRIYLWHQRMRAKSLYL